MARSHGVLTRAQLHCAGLERNAIAHRLRVGRLHRLHRGVYAVGYCGPSPLTRALAAVLACGPAAVLSHRSAAALWELGRWPPGPVDVAAPRGHEHPGIAAHRSRTLTPSDVTCQRGIPVTTPARTLIDVAGLADAGQLARMVNEARLRWNTSLEELETLTARLPGRNVARLRPLLERDGAPTRSTFEDRFLAFAKLHRLPPPEVNRVVAGYEVDMLWRTQRLVVELDGRTHHDTARSFESDRERDADLVAAGVRVVRVTWRRLTEAPEREAARLRALLAA